MKTIFERSKDILKSNYIIKTIDKIPQWMPKQQILVEFARDAALHIIASQPVVEEGRAECAAFKNECNLKERVSCDDCAFYKSPAL